MPHCRMPSSCTVNPAARNIVRSSAARAATVASIRSMPHVERVIDGRPEAEPCRVVVLPVLEAPGVSRQFVVVGRHELHAVMVRLRRDGPIEDRPH